MTERSFILKDEMGLHARPAAMLMVRMLHVRSTVEIICGDRRADGKDVMSIMAMNTTAGDEVIFRIDGPDEEAAMKEVEADTLAGDRRAGAETVQKNVTVI